MKSEIPSGDADTALHAGDEALRRAVATARTVTGYRMRNPKKIHFKNPPISEVGLTVMFDTPTVYPAYNVASFHALVRDEYPFVQQQLPFVGIEPFPTHGDTLKEQSIQFGEAPRLNRWWFLNANAHKLVQIQEDMLALNWRRYVQVSGQDSYPGFNQILADFENYVEKVRKVERPTTHPFPKPTRCELLLDNLIPLEVEGQRFRMSEALAGLRPIGPEEGRPLLAFQMGWFERMEGRDIDQPQDFSVKISVVSAEIGGHESRPFARMIMVARSDVSEWNDVSAFFVRARKHATMRLLELTTDAVRATWS